MLFIQGHPGVEAPPRFLDVIVRRLVRDDGHHRHVLPDGSQNRFQVSVQIDASSRCPACASLSFESWSPRDRTRGKSRSAYLSRQNISIIINPYASPFLFVYEFMGSLACPIFPLIIICITAHNKLLSGFVIKISEYICHIYIVFIHQGNKLVCKYLLYMIAISQGQT